MKKLMFAVGLGLISGNLWAACVGPYCYDDTGAAIRASVGFQGDPYFTHTHTVAAINASTATYQYQMEICTDCVQSLMCLSTGTTNCNQWVVVGGTTTTAGTLMRCR